MVRLNFTEIYTRHGDVIIVDADDYADLAKYTWRLNAHGYAVRDQRVLFQPQTVTLHRSLFNLPRGVGIVDHINGNPRDNRRANLRLVTARQNAQNVRTKRRYKGVYPVTGGFQAKITHHKRQIYLGYFRDEKDAAKAYNDAAAQLFGEFARLNPL